MKYKLIYIEWCDAESENDGWKSYDECLKWCDNSNWVVKMTGYILKETEEYILFACQMGIENEDTEQQFGGLFKLPTTWIRKRKVLKI